jgi:hypothetical protein
MNRILIVVTALTFTGCIAPLTEAGSRVRRVQPDWSTRCEFLGVVEGTWGDGGSIADDQLGAMNDLRNKVAVMGGNAYSITQEASSMMRTVVQADAYSCP